MKLSCLLFPLTLLTSIIATIGVHTVSDQITSDCANDDWCISFKSMNAALGGQDGVHDVTIHYDASEPEEDGFSKYYRVSIRDHETCYKPVVADSGIEIPSNYIEGKIPYSEYTDDDDAGNKAGFIAVGLDIDTAALENSALTSHTNDNKIEMIFCVNIDLVNISGSQAVPAATIQTRIVLNIIRSQDFFSVYLEDAEDTVDEETENFVFNYNLQACVCSAGDSDLSVDGTCLSDYVGLQPASFFKLCVKSLDSEVKVTSLKGISFKAKASGTPDAPDVVEIVIVNSSGKGVGPASDPVCDPNTGICVVSALTYAMMYEHNDGTNNIDISSWGRMEGTSILEFTDSTTRQTQTNRSKVNRFNISMGLASSVSGCGGIHATIQSVITELFLFFD